MDKMEIKSLPIGAGDIEPMLLMVQNYRSYLHATHAARQRIQRLDALQQRLQSFLLRSRNGPLPAMLPLTLEDWRALHAALQGWVAVLRLIFPPSAEREMVIDSTLALARYVESMLSSRP